MKSTIFYLIPLFFGLSACDCYYHITAVVLDKETKEPLSGVIVSNFEQVDGDLISKIETQSSQDGMFTVSKVSEDCLEKSFLLSVEGYVNKEVQLLNNSFDTIYLVPQAKFATWNFNQKEDFQILRVERENNHEPDDSLSSGCDKWSLSGEAIKDIIHQAQPISGPEWHHLFGHYPCWINGKIKQGETEYQYSINNGSWLNIWTKDSTLRLGVYNDKHRKHFLDAPWTEQDEDVNQEWRQTEAFKFQNFREYKLTQSILIDLDGDGQAEEVYMKSKNDCRSIIIEKGDSIIELGCENESHLEIPQPFNWVKMWCVVYDEQVHEVLLTKDLDILEDTLIILERPSIYIGHPQAGGGIITYRNGKLHWVHQSD